MQFVSVNNTQGSCGLSDEPREARVACELGELGELGVLTNGASAEIVIAATALHT